VAGLSHGIENSGGFPEPCGRVIRACRSENESECQGEKVLCFSHKCCPFLSAQCTQLSKSDASMNVPETERLPVGTGLPHP
jgi:hypothetical protein